MTQACDRVASGRSMVYGADVSTAPTELEPDVTLWTHVQRNTPLESLEDRVNRSPKYIGCEPDMRNYNDSMRPPVQPHLHPQMHSPPPPPVLPPSGLNIPPPPAHILEDAPGLVSASTQSAFVDRLEREQEDLRDIRDSVLGSRFRLRAQRSKLRNARMAASAKEGSLLNMLRQYLHEHGLPQHIRAELEEVSDLRDRLGPMESSYDELEMEYDAQEWNYTRKESRFIEELVDNNFVVVGVAHPSTNNSQAARLTSSAMRGLEDFDRESLFGGPHGANPENWEHSLDISDDLAHISPVHGSEETTYPNFISSGHSVVQNFGQGNRSHNLHERRAWARKIEEIDKWLQDQVSKSPILKIHSEVCQQKMFLERDIWWEQVKQNWMSKQDGLPEFHTGDSTISDILTSPCTSVKPEVLDSNQGHARTDSNHEMWREIPNSETSEPLNAKKMFTTYATLVEERKTIHGSLTMKPATISATTDETPSRRSSSSLDKMTDTTSHDSWIRGHCMAQSVEQFTPERGPHVNSPHHRQNSEHDSQSAPATPKQQGTERRNSVIPQLRSNSIQHDTHEESLWDVSASSSGALGPLGLTSKLSSTGCHTISSPIAPSESSLEPAQLMLSPSPALTVPSTPCRPGGVESQAVQQHDRTINNHEQDLMMRHVVSESLDSIASSPLLPQDGCSTDGRKTSNWVNFYCTQQWRMFSRCHSR
ncbi:hypothetical protein J1614_011137 [Plenodomus biglobosus]|nr:hypothetical protein J1614_011137 [Plenodomus biglobosus]